MLVAHPTRLTPRSTLRRSRAPLRIYSPPAEVGPGKPAAESPATRTGELQPIGQLMPQVLARYFAPGK
ncbi:MAG: hypothetical protein ACKVP0_21320 [Pirellulaceae bacterium]